MGAEVVSVRRARMGVDALRAVWAGKGAEKWRGGRGGAFSPRWRVREVGCSRTPAITHLERTRTKAIFRRFKIYPLTQKVVSGLRRYPEPR